MEAWVEIETAAHRKGYSSGVVMKLLNPFQLIEDLIKSGVLPNESIGMLRDLRTIRNEASHLPDYIVSYKDAEKYINMTLKVIQSLK